MAKKRKRAPRVKKPGVTVGDKLRDLRALVPLGPSPLGQLYSAPGDLTRKYQSVTLWTIFRSDQNTHLIRPHKFISRKKARTSQQWRDWFAANIDDIQRKYVLSGLNDRTGRTYFIYKKLGWIGHARKFIGTSALGRTWRPAKPSGVESE